MYTTLATRLAVGTTETMSSPVSMSGANAAQFDATVYTVDGTPTLNIYLDGSNDLENWVQLDDEQTASVGYFQQPAPTKDIGLAYVRLRYSTTQGTAVINAGLYTYHE